MALDVESVVGCSMKRVLPQSLLRMCLHMQNTRAQKVWPGSTIHSPVEGFEAVDLSFRLTITPWLFDRVSYGVNIPAQCAGEALHGIFSGPIRRSKSSSGAAAG